MSVSHRYRNFGGGKRSVGTDADNTSEALEDQKLQAFEAGYQAGWDDAMKAKADEKDKLTTELGQNLIDMSFTYQEALLKLTVSLEPTMRQIVEKLLPEIVRTALSAHIFEQVQALLKSKMERPIEIVVSPQNVETVKNIVGPKLKEPFKIVGEESLGDGQAFVRIGDDERQIDLDTLISEVAKAMTAFFHESAQEEANG